MSDVYRYEFDENGVCYRKPDGPFVSHDDYAAIHYERIHDLNQIGGLQQENARLKTEVEHLMVFCNSTLIPSKELQAHVERLRKAGDAMQKSMLECGPNEMAEAFHYDDWWVSYYGWNAAKEGKPSV